MFLLTSWDHYFINIQGSYDMVDKVWKLGSYIKEEGGWLGPLKEF